MVSISRIRASNALITADTVPRVAVVAGGTAGIGKATLSLLVSKKTPIKIYVVGRDEAKMKPFLDQLRQSNDQADIIGLEGQVSSLADTKRLCDKIKSQENSIDLLFLSAGAIPIAGRQGIPPIFVLLQCLTKTDKCTTFRYLGRYRVILIPNLLLSHRFYARITPPP